MKTGARRCSAFLLGTLIVSTIAWTALRAHRLGKLNKLFDPATVVELRLSFGKEAENSLSSTPRSYVPGVLNYEGQQYSMAVHIKGNRSRRKLKNKPAFKIQFNRYTESGTFLGLRKLNLNNMVEDPTMMRELLSYGLLEELGLPHPRAAYARLIVNNKPQGLYLVVESLDNDFATRLFGDKHGPLYEAAYGCDLFHNDVDGFDLDAGKDPDRRQLQLFASRANREPALLFDPSRGPLVLEQFFTFLALSTIIGDFDGYHHSHNYYLYQDPEQRKWQFIPWGLDRTFKKRLAIYDSNGWLAKRCFGYSSCRIEYVRTLTRIATRFEELHLSEQLQRLQALIQSSLEGEKRTPKSTRKAIKATEKLLTFIQERPSEIRSQIGCIDKSGNEVDRDNDGFGCLDCRDDDPRIHPNANELCNQVDDNCSGLIDDHPDCECDSFEHNNQSYSLCQQPMNWITAANFCDARGEQLARIDTVGESRALYKAARKLDKQRWWIGYSDRKREGRFRWRDGSQGDFAFWRDRQPDNGKCNQDCVTLKENGRGRWNDTHCNQRRPFICSPRVDSSPTHNTRAVPR